MQLLKFLQTTGGLAFLYFTQTILFSMMVYVLAAEYLRTKRDDLVYKLVAAINITLINVATTSLLVMESFYKITFSQKYYPLIFNTMFAIIVLSLARAFVYSHVKNKDRFKLNIRIGMILSAVMYAAMQAYWYIVFQPGMEFGRSYLQLIFSVFFIIILIFSIFYIIKFRKSYRIRLVTAFISILAAQFINIIGVLIDDLPGYMSILRAAAPILVPMMFGSVVFKELIENVVMMVEYLNNSLENQKSLVFEMISLGSELSEVSDSLVSTSTMGWQKLSVVVENIYAQEANRAEILKKTKSTIDEINAMDDSIKTDETTPNSRIDIASLEMDAEQAGISSTMSEAAIKVAAVQKEISEAGTYIRDLKEHSGKIMSALEEIAEISDKTRMLALNASIEAARAGEHGKGFSIVADEVGKLADQSNSSTQTISDIIKSIQTGVESSNSRLVLATDNMKGIISEVKKIQNYFKDSIIMSALYHQIVSNNKEASVQQKKSTSRVHEEMISTAGLLEKDSSLGEQMRDSISNHIREIEAIAGMSDKLNDMISNLNQKANDLIKAAELLSRATS